MRAVDAEGPASDDLFAPRMPDVEDGRNVDSLFSKVRALAALDTTPGHGTTRHVVVVTPGRMAMMHPCPEPGSLTAEHVRPVEQLLPRKPRRRVAIIAYTDLDALRANAAAAIPFFGLLTGLAYVGHAVWVFEGHPSAVAAGCRDADVVIADGAMLPFLAADWTRTAASVMPRPQFYVHDRTTFSIRRLSLSGKPVAA